MKELSRNHNQISTFKRRSQCQLKDLTLFYYIKKIKGAEPTNISTEFNTLKLNKFVDSMCCG